MEFIEIIERLFSEYGYWVLLLGLPLDAIALPIPPGNTTLAYTGYLSFKGILDWRIAILAAYAGSVIGMTITYWFGYVVGMPLIDRYGKWLFFKPVYLEKTRRAYEKYGNIVMLISFFMPGVRQFIGYFAGIIRVPFWTFVIYAYIGSALWVSVFIGIGKIFGEQWQTAFMWLAQFLGGIFIGIIVLCLLILAFHWQKKGNHLIKRRRVK